MKIPAAKESLELYLTCVSTVSTGALSGKNGPQGLLCGVGVWRDCSHSGRALQVGPWETEEGSPTLETVLGLKYKTQQHQ